MIERKRKGWKGGPRNREEYYEIDNIYKLSEAIARSVARAPSLWEWGDGHGSYILKLVEYHVVEIVQQAERHPGKNRNPIPQDVRDFVKSRDGGRCLICRETKFLEIDHIVPVARGGTNEKENLQTLCRTCNLQKGSMTMNEYWVSVGKPGLQSVVS